MACAASPQASTKPDRLLPSRRSAPERIISSLTTLVARCEALQRKEFPMLKGFTVPRTPQGRASIDPPPPWHYSSDVLAVEFWADPKVTASMLPRGLSPDPKT